MKIVIAGAGEMGSHLAKMLSGNGHDITVIDSDPKLLADVASLADVLTVEGDSTTFAVLRKASVRKCDLFIAVNHVENDNVVAAVLAKQLGPRNPSPGSTTTNTWNPTTRRFLSTWVSTTCSIRKRWRRRR